MTFLCKIEVHLKIHNVRHDGLVGRVYIVYHGFYCVVTLELGSGYSAVEVVVLQCYKGVKSSS